MLYSQNNYEVGVYCRLSRDDNNGNQESMSIANQRQMLMNYVKEKGWTLRETYIDDGFSGTNFDRPDFQRMIADAKMGKIDCVITKDMSRLGRNYLKTGYYTEEFFPSYGIRFIAVSDNVDTMLENNDILPFQNILNEWYPKDISKKVRQVKKSCAQQGKFIGSHAPYGYQKSLDDKYKLVVDEYAATIVRRIFSEFCGGDSARLIGERLTQERVDSPRFYSANKHAGQKPKVNETNNWCSPTIFQILKNPVYIGNMVQGKRQVVSFKTKKRQEVDPANWIVVQNTHEAIISQKTWDDVQEKLSNNRHHVRRTKENGDKTFGLFSSALFCADCGSRLAYQSKPKAGAYRCSRYNNGGKTACSTHYIMENVLEEFVLNDIQQYARLATADRTELEGRLTRALNHSQDVELRQIELQKQKIEHRQAEVSNALKNLFEDKCRGALTEAVFCSLADGYAKEQNDLSIQQQAIYEQLSVHRDAKEKATQWLSRVQGCLEINSLSRDVVMELIDNIIIGEPYVKDGCRTQPITIRYRFIGSVLSDAKEDIA